MSKLTAAEENLLMKGFDYATDSNGFDPSWDEADVLKYLEQNPGETVATKIARAINIPVHRVIAARNRLDTAGKLPTIKATIIEFPVTETCSTGNVATVEKTVATEEPLTVITLWQPWATFIIKGIKTYETRSWYTSHRGKILIHAAKRKINWDELDIESLEEIYPDVRAWEYPLGAIVGETELVECRQCGAVRVPVSESDRLTGDWSDGRYAWEMRNVKPLFIPNVKGKQGLWKYEPLIITDAVLGESVQSDEPLNCEQSQNILLTEPPRQVEPNGQLSLFFDNSEEPPDPDDFESMTAYIDAWRSWESNYPELAKAVKSKSKSKVFVTPKDLKDYCQFEKGDRIQKTSNPKWVGEIQSISKKGISVKYSCGFETIHQSDELTLFAKANSESVLGESFFKVGEKVTSDYNFKGKVFTVKSIYPSGMVGLIGESSQVVSLPSHWLNYHIEKIESKPKSIPLEQTEQTTRKRPAKGCGSGYLMTRAANIKRNEAKGKPPDCYYCYCFSYTNQYGKEIKSSISVPRAKISQVKQMVESKEHYIKIAKFLGKSLPMSY